MQTRTSSVVIWLITSVIAALSCSLTLPAARLDGEYIPVGNDSLYHARRILDAVHDPRGFYQFDSKIHAPEGSLLVWPWGYDYAMAQLVRIGLALGFSDNPMAILDWIPVAAVFASLGLLVLIARQLGLSTWLVALAALCLALSPTTQLLHGPGDIDHHYVEMICMLAAVATGIAWLQHPESRRYAALLGVVLGVAPAIHNGLFILQIPVLATFAVRWLQGKRPTHRTASVFSAVLLTASLCVLVPSLPFRLGRFEFYTLSWFHLYIAGCTALTVTLLGQIARSARAIGVLGALAVALLMPIGRDVFLAETFLAGANAQLQVIGEMRSPLSMVLELGGSAVAQIYSYLVFLAPATIAVCAIQIWRERQSARLLFWITSLLALVLLSLQLRMHYFGSFALYLPWLLLLESVARRRPELRKKVHLLVSLGALILYAPVLRYQLISPMPPSNDAAFRDLRPLFATLHRACADDPGVVLADSSLGHYVRYFSDCAVIANNFLLTPQHFAKVDEAARLLSQSAADLARQSARIKYVVLRPLDMQLMASGKVGYRFYYPGTQRLAADLLFVSSDAVPAGYHLLHQVSRADLNGAPFARLLRIEASPRTSPPAGAERE